MKNQNNVNEDNLSKNKGQKENSDFNFIYFIDTHKKEKNFKIHLPQEYEGADSLERIKEFENKNEPIEFISVVYRFKIIPDSLKKEEDEKCQILILGEDEEGKTYQTHIEFIYEKKDFFIYDFNIEENDYQPLSHEEQFNIYVEILRKTYNKKMNSPENEFLISSTIPLLDEKGKKISLVFYVLILLEGYKTKYIKEYLLKFKKENIEGFGEFKESSIKKIKTTLNALSKDPIKSFDLKDSNEERELFEIFYSILLYFNMNYQQEKINDLFKDEKIFTYLSKKLITFKDFFQGLILEKDIVRLLIKTSKTFEEILAYLH